MVIHANSGDEPGLIDVDFDDLYSRGYRRCIALGYVLTGSAVDANDLVQDAFSTAYRRWAEIARYDDPLAWVRKVMVNNAMSHTRRLRREVAAMARFGNRPPAANPAIDERDRELWLMVSKLPKQQAAAIALHYVDDLTVDSIAEVLGCSAGTVKTHLSRGRHALASRLTAPTKEAMHDE
ncbi:MAG: polymerase sigma-70 factor, subfamily [Ilumatobacteraceae bacterium]